MPASDEPAPQRRPVDQTRLRDTPERLSAPLHLIENRVLQCRQCGRHYTVRNWAPDREVFCPTCSIRLAEPISELSLDAARPQALPPIPTLPSARDLEGAPFGRYRLLAELGHGGMGVVWKAWDTQLQRVVALKQILSRGPADAGLIERFLREARAAARLKHPNIVGVLDVGVIDAQHYFTCEYIDGESLDRIAKRETLPGRRVVEIVRAIAEALAYAHGHDVLHRDIKPGNILVDGSGRPYVMDFGLAKDIGREATAGLTVSGDLLGTPAFMSPEQAAGRTAELGPATDQFSLGVVLYSLLTGRLPFEPTGFRELLNAVIESDPVPPTRLNPKIHRDLETICLRTLEKDPGRRYGSMGEFAADLGRYLEGEPIQARPASLVGRIVRKSVKHRAIVIPSAAAALLAIGLGGFAIGGSMERQRTVRDGLEDGRAFRAAKKPKEAWESYQRVLKIESLNGEALEGAAWADAEDRRFQQAEENLKKAGLVQNVLARWMSLAEPLREMEAIVYETRTTLADKRTSAGRHWLLVQEFMDGTPKDATSQATMLAFAGWARRLAGYEKEGLKWMAESRGLDPSLPYGALTEAMTLFAKYLELQPLPALRIDDLGLRFTAAPKESEKMQALRKEIESLLDQASTSPVWGEGLAMDFQLAVRAIQAMQAGRYEEAEQGLSAALQSAALQTMKSDLLLARARARYATRRFEDAIGDLERVAVLRPAYVPVFLEMSRHFSARAMEVKRAGGDWSPFSIKAAESMRRARVLDPSTVRITLMRAKTAYLMGQLKKSVREYSDAIESDPACVAAWCGRAEAQKALGELTAAASDYEAALSITPNSTIAHLGLAEIYLHTGDRVAGLNSVENALAADATCAAAFLARARIRLANREWDLALTDCDAAIQLGERDPEAYSVRAEIRVARGEISYAITDLQRALQIAPRNWRGRTDVEDRISSLNAALNGLPSK